VKPSAIKLPTYITRFVYLFFFIDVIILVLHLLFGIQQHFFHIDFEQNLPTVYQSLKLIGFGIGFLIVSVRKSIAFDIKSFIIPLALFLLFLGLDELLQIHENIYRIFELFDAFHPSKIVEASMKMGYRSSLWILYYFPLIVIFVFWCGYWLRFFQSNMRESLWILFASVICLFTILLAEIVSSTGTYSENTYFWFVTIEESAEMLLASLLGLVGMTMLTKRKASK
jgi:hypothetical protein